MCQGFIHFSGFLHHFVLAKLATATFTSGTLLNDGIGTAFFLQSRMLNLFTRNQKGKCLRDVVDTGLHHTQLPIKAFHLKS